MQFVFYTSCKNKAFDLYVQFIAQFLYFTIIKMKQLTVKATKSLMELESDLTNYKITLEEGYSRLYNILSEFDGENLLEDFITVDYAEEMARWELTEGGMARLYYFMGDVNWNTAEIVHLDGYGNCEEATSDDLTDIIDDVIDDYGANADIYEE